MADEIVYIPPQLPEGARAIPDLPWYCIKADGTVFTRRCRRCTNVIGPWRVLSPGKLSKDDYLQVVVYVDNGFHKKIGIHILLLTAFVGPRPTSKWETYVARHLDDNRLNNSLENLAWGTSKDNVYDSMKNGKSKWRFGSRHPCAKVNEEKVVEMRKLHKEGFHHNEIAKMFGISTSTARAICHRISWIHVP